MAWKASAILYRAVRARETGRTEEFQGKYAQAIDLLAEAKKLAPGDTGVAAATGGMYAVLADRLPEELRGRAWAAAYEAYQALWKVQERGVEKLPLPRDRHQSAASSSFHRPTLGHSASSASTAEASG